MLRCVMMVSSSMTEGSPGRGCLGTSVAGYDRLVNEQRSPGELAAQRSRVILTEREPSRMFSGCSHIMWVHS
jgi:hypothetical protein